MGVALAAMFMVIGIAAFLLLCNIALSIYYKQKLTHVAAVVAQSSDLTAGGSANSNMRAALTDVLQLIGLRSAVSSASLVGGNQSPYQVQVMVSVPLFGDGSVIPGVVPLRADARSPENSVVGYLTVPGSARANGYGVGAGHTWPPNYCVWLPIIKSPPLGTGTPQGSWFLNGTEMGHSRTDCGVGIPSAGFAMDVPPGVGPGYPGGPLDPR